MKRVYANKAGMAVPRLLTAIALTGAIAVSGCTGIYKVMRGDPHGLVAAEPLKVTDTDLQTQATKTDVEKREYLGGVVLDSEVECTDFLDNLVFSENSVNTTGDILSTTMSSLATLFTPLSTVHALTAGATITTGSKAAIDSDIYAKASITTFQTALEQTYFKSIGTYRDALPTMANIVVSVEVAKIESIHATCSLAAAENSITATLNSPGGVPVKPTGLAATAYKADVELKWSQVSSAKTYSVYEGTAAGGEAATPVATGLTVPTYSAKGLTNGTTYFFKVGAENAAGLSPLSDEVSATPSAALGAPPAPPPPATHGVVPGQSLN